MRHSLSKFRFFAWAILSIAASLQAQSSPHPQYRQRYYVRMSEGLFRTPNNLSNPEFQVPGFIWVPALSIDVTLCNGYDSLFIVPEYNMPVGAFMAYSHEVSNAEYREFVKDSLFSSQVLRPADTSCLRADETEDWKWTLYKQYYFQHDAYSQYPVIGVSHTQAKEYCRWLKTRLEQNPEFMRQLRNAWGENAWFEVDLPSLMEYQALYQVQVREPFQRSTGPHQYSDPLLEYTISSHKNPYVNWAEQGLRSNRGALLMPSQTASPFTVPVLEPQPAATAATAKKKKNQVPSASWGPFHHLLGNVAEWTSSPAENHLFNNISYTLNTSDQIIVNQYQIPTEKLLEGRLHSPQDLQTHFAVWGGSWDDEWHYLQASAAQFLRLDQRQPDLGFRPVIRFYKP